MQTDKMIVQVQVSNYALFYDTKVGIIPYNPFLCFSILFMTVRPTPAFVQTSFYLFKRHKKHVQTLLLKEKGAGR